MKDVREYILNSLIDKYEDSLLYREENQNAINISLKFNKKTMPSYYNELNSFDKDQINVLCKNLELKQYLTIVWEKYEEGNIIKQVNLNIHHVKEVYAYLNRKELKLLEQEAINILSKYVHDDTYLDTFSSYMIQELKSGKSVSKYLDLHQPKLIDDILYSLSNILKQKDEISKRIFSIKLFKNSKYFESIEHKVLKIMKDFGNYIDEEQILEEHNIVKNPGYIYLKGTGKFKIGKETIDLTQIQGEIGISSNVLKEMNTITLEAKRVITIENLTSFHTYPNHEDLVIYLGGFLNHIRESFLIKLYQRHSTMQFLHWGDIDLGGFRIFNHLRLKTGIPFTPYLMDLNTLMKYESYGMDESRIAYLDSLLVLLKDQNYHYFHEVILYMIEKKLRLEQEIIEFE